ncbi:MAG: IS5 family transposase [Paracoccaceae bacterium]
MAVSRSAGTSGQILDASIVPVPRNHYTHEKNAAIKDNEKPEG